MLNFIVYDPRLDSIRLSEDVTESMGRRLGKSGYYGLQPPTILQEHTWHKGHGPDAEHRKRLPL